MCRLDAVSKPCLHKVCLSRDRRRLREADTVGSRYADFNTRHLGLCEACKNQDEEA